MHILGISAYYHDSAAALIEDGRVIAAAQEERFSRKKHDPRFPADAIRYCLDEAGIGFGEIEHVVFYDKPFLKFERLIETYLAFAPRGFRSFSMAIPLWLREKLFLKDLLLKELRMIALLRQVAQPDNSENAKWANMRIHRIFSDMMVQLGYSSKLNAEWEFLCMLRDEGRRAGDEFLSAHGDDLGRHSTLDLDELLEGV